MCAHLPSAMQQSATRSLLPMRRQGGGDGSAQRRIGTIGQRRHPAGGHRTVGAALAAIGIDCCRSEIRQRGAGGRAALSRWSASRCARATSMARSPSSTTRSTGLPIWPMPCSPALNCSTDRADATPRAASMSRCAACGRRRRRARRIDGISFGAAVTSPSRSRPTSWSAATSGTGSCLIWRTATRFWFAAGRARRWTVTSAP